MSETSLYQDLKAAGCELDNHESDLYVLADDTALKVLDVHRVRRGMFRSSVDGAYWYEVPFAFDPWWDARGARDK